MPRKNNKGRKNGRPKKQPVNLVDLSLGLVGANAVTMGLFGTGLRTFMVEGWFGKGKTERSDNSWEITLGEILTDPHNFAGVSSNYKGGFTGAVQKNIRDNGFMSAATLIVLPMASKVVKKAIRPLTNAANKSLKQLEVKAVKF